MPLAWPPKRAHPYAAPPRSFLECAGPDQGRLGYRHKESDTDTPQGQYEMSSWSGVIYVSVISLHDIVVHVA
jgi:hypothetical protein